MKSSRVGRGCEENFKGNWNFLGGGKEGSFEEIKMNEKHVRLVGLRRLGAAVSCYQ